jgi:MFS family permease
MKKNVFLLAICQATFNTGQALMLTAAPFIGLALAADPTFATLPIAIQFGATLAMTWPAAFLMKHIGRRSGFLIGTLLALSGSAVAAYAITAGSFALFCAGLALNGLFNGFGTYFRFAAADVATPDYRARAVSYVMAGGVAAAILGPNLARYTADALPTAQFAGSYVALIGIYLVTFVALWFINFPKPTMEERHGRGRPLAIIARTPKFAVAVLGGMIAYAVMNLIMTSTPLAMHEHHYPFSDAAFIIQWHMLAMFGPSFFTGRLIGRYGAPRLMQCGAAFCALCVGANVASTELWATWLALVSLGLGWNFLFVGATTLLTETYSVEEKAKVQATNDFLILSITTITAFSSGPLHHHAGWDAINLSVAPLIVLAAFAVTWLKRRAPDAAPVTAGQPARE